MIRNYLHLTSLNFSCNFLIQIDLIQMDYTLQNRLFIFYFIIIILKLLIINRIKYKKLRPYCFIIYFYTLLCILLRNLFKSLYLVGWCDFRNFLVMK